jgi:hypothetical protein
MATTKEKLGYGIAGCLFGIFITSFAIYVMTTLVFFCWLPTVTNAFAKSFATVNAELNQSSIKLALLSYKSKDYSGMVETLKNTAETDAEAANAVGECYELGLGVTAEIAEAKKWYRDAAAKGSKIAQSNLERLAKNPKNRLRGSELPCLKTGLSSAWTFVNGK